MYGICFVGEVIVSFPDPMHVPSRREKGLGTWSHFPGLHLVSFGCVCLECTVAIYIHIITAIFSYE